MKHRILKAAVAGIAFCGLLTGCATTVDWGGPLGHYRYHYDSRPVVSSSRAAGYDEHATWREPVLADRPVVSFYRHGDDDD